MAELLRKGLAEEGHTAVCSHDGVEGLAIAKAYEFDVIILDVMMPKLDGYEMAKRLRAEKIRTPVLMLTAKDTVPDIAVSATAAPARSRVFLMCPSRD